MNKLPRKLNLSRTTVRPLADDKLGNAAGGRGNGGSLFDCTYTCPSNRPVGCGPFSGEQCPE